MQACHKITLLKAAWPLVWIGHSSFCLKSGLAGLVHGLVVHLVPCVFVKPTITARHVWRLNCVQDSRENATSFQHSSGEVRVDANSGVGTADGTAVGARKGGHSARLRGPD